MDTDWASISETMTAWGSHRDAGRWDRLEGLFAPGATLELTWVRATASEFVAAARRHAAGRLRSKHVIANPCVTVAGDRAIAETNALLVNDQPDLDLGAITHIRYLDRLVRVDGHWAIAHRVSVYDSCGLTFPYGPVDIDRSAIRRFPREYAGLAYLLQLSGYEPSDRSPTRGGTREHELRESNAAWVASVRPPRPPR